MELICGDMLKEHARVESGSVDLILMDPPYGIMNGFNGINWDISIPPDDIFRISNRILRKNGRLLLFSQEPYTSRLITNTIPNLSFNYRAMWVKDNFANALLVNKAMVSHSEDVLIFTKKHDFEELHPLREYFKHVLKHTGKNKKTIINIIGQKVDHTLRFDSSQFSLCTENTYNELIQHFNIDKMEGFKPYKELNKELIKLNEKYPTTFNLWDGKKYKSNILKYKKDYDGYHPTQKPVALLEDLIKTYSNPGDIVADLTMGSGSTGVACVNTARDFIGIELDKGYFDIAKKRINSVA